MEEKNLSRRALSALCILALLCTLLCGCGAREETGIRSLADLGRPGMTIATAEDMPEWETLQRDYPEAELLVFNSDAAYQNVAMGKIDACVFSRIEMELAMKNGVTGVRILEEDYSREPVGIGVSPKTEIPELREKINAFLAEMKADGTLDDMYRRWVTEGDETMPEIPAPTQPSVRLVVGTTGLIAPFSYYKGPELYGYDVELAYRFAAWLDADLKFKVYDFGGLLSAAQTGDVDCAMSNLFYSPERDERLPFSDTLFEVPIAVMVQDNGTRETTLDDVRRGRIACLSGSAFPDIVMEYLPDTEPLLYPSAADEIAALKGGKVDAIAFDDAVARTMQASDKSLRMLPDVLDHSDFAFIFPKSEAGEALRDEVDAYLLGLKADGTLEAMQQKWFDCEDLRTPQPLDYRAFPATRGTVRLATTIEYPPFTVLYEGGLCSGYEVELLAMFCRDNGYALEVQDVNFEGLLATVQSGKCDVGSDCISVTEERKEAVLFSVPSYTGGTALIVLKKGLDGEKESVLSSLRGSFEKTFLRENRWQLFMQGIGTTMLITVLSILFGTALGFGVFLLCRKGNPVANALTRFFVWLVQGMPVVVLLMVFYYVIFGSVSISGTAVSVVAFTLVFGSGVYAMVKAGVATVDRGQTEAAYALGYTDRRSFFRIILPQALPHILPVYKGEITALIKATAVVGYVAVQDLTKMGDIVRSRTYEAFFPLIAVAVIYFVLAAILTAIVNRIELRIDPRRRSREDVLKGVNGK